MFRPFACAAVLAASAISLPAHAHITARPDAGPAGSYFMTTFTVPHGCGPSPTVAVRITIPEGVAIAKPQMKPGWTVTIHPREAGQGHADHAGRDHAGRRGHAAHGEGPAVPVADVEWRGGPLPPSMYDTFGLLMKLPDAPGRTLYFPTVQECADGATHWTGIPAEGQRWHDVPTPAPFVRITPKSP